MNKKNMMMVTVLIAAYSSPALTIAPLSAQEEALRVEYVRGLSKANALGVSQYLEDGAIGYDLIDRDIALLQKDSKQALNNKSWAQGYFYSWILPGFGKAITIGSGLGAAASSVATAIISKLTYDVWNSSCVLNGVGKFQSKLIEYSGASFLDRMQEKAKLFDAKIHYLTDKKGDPSGYNKAVFNIAPAVPFTFAGAMVLTGLSIYAGKKVSRYKQNNAAFIQQMQENYNNNQIAIARLQEIAYQVRSK